MGNGEKGGVYGECHLGGMVGRMGNLTIFGNGQGHHANKGKELCEIDMFM
jgi:hypothetical protein